MINFNKIFYYYKFTYKILCYEIFFSFKYKTLFEKKLQEYMDIFHQYLLLIIFLKLQEIF